MRESLPLFLRLAITACLVAGCAFTLRALTPDVIATPATIAAANSHRPVHSPAAPGELSQPRAPSDSASTSSTEPQLVTKNIDATGAKVGGSIHMELHEMGLNGPAEVVGIDACPQIEADDGTGRNVVTGTMAHAGANILYLDITGLDEPLGVTDTHPIWSETRQDFVVAGQLEVGEQFRTLTGESATLTKIHPHRGPPELVFNLEVDAEHVYAVAGNGLLVHNDCYDDALAALNITTSSTKTDPSFVYTIYKENGDLHKFGVQMLLEID